MQNKKLKFTTIASFLKKNLANVTILAILVSVLVIDFNLKYWNHPKRVIEWDVINYYSYLPAIFIDKDLSLAFWPKNQEKYSDFYWPIKTPTGKYAIVTTMGMSFLYAPFFFTAHIVTPFTDFEPNGFTVPYKFALMMASLFYLILGLFVLKKILENYFNQYVIALTLLSIGIGTNLLIYTTYHDAPMSHVFNFALITVFLYYVIKWHKSPTLKYTITIGLLSGLIALIRPTNVLVLLILFFYGIESLKGIWPRILFFLENYKKVLIMIISFVAVWIPQFIYWKYISGQFFYDTYGELGGRFFFNNPQILDFLFSYRKGWLLYTPIMIFALAGIPVLYFRMRQFFMPILIYLIVMIYALSSWWSWWFGGGYGMRALIDLYGILAIPFAAFLYYSYKQKKIFGYLSAAIVIGLIWFSTFQSRQYVNGAIHYVGMTKEAYWETFMKPYPTEKYWSYIRFPDYDSARIGVYKVVDPKNMPRPKPEISPEDALKGIEKQIWQNKPQLILIREKAEARGISVDSMITLDAMWIYKKWKKKRRW